MRRILGWTAGVLVVVLLAGLTAGGWYYSDQLLPAPVPLDPDFVAEVVASDEASGELVFAATEGDLVDLATVGFRTADGLVLLDGQPELDRDEVTRQGELLDGAWPEAGDLGAAVVDTFAGDPATTLGIPFETIQVASPLGPLPAWRTVPVNATTDTWVVLVHGRGGAKSEGNRVLATAHDLGLPTLTISVRNDPDAPADPQGFGYYGSREWEDLQAATDHLTRVEGAERVVLVGYSQGASVILTYLRRSASAEAVDAAVLVSPLVSLHATLVLQAQQRNIPDLVIPPLLVATRLVAEARSELEFAEVEHLDHLDDLPADVPLLVTHGAADRTVPVEPTRDLAAARPDQVVYEEYADTDHVREWNQDRERFDTDLRAFLDQHVD